MKNLTVFSRKDIKRRIRNFSFTKIKNKDDKTYRIGNWIKNIESGKILMQKEEELQSLFLHTFFGEVLSYDYQNPNNWNLMEEAKMKFDATKSDGALGFFSIDENKNIKRDIRAVIELKNARTVLDKKQNRKDFKGSSVEQAFMYVTKIGKTCKWVIISNFLEIRLYHANDINKYEYFDILELGKKEEFERFYFLMANGQLFLEKQNSIIENALEERIEKEKKITLEFYAHYKTLRELFVHHLISHNKNISPLKLISLAQKIIDRIVFISVVKDYGLLSYNIVRMLERTASYSFAMDGEELWRQLKHLFNAMDKGFSPRVLQFNGGLYKDNPEINNLKIKDFFLYKLLKLSSYDFESDLNINILGHIFENSISDIEDLKNSFLNKKIEVLDENIDQLIKKNVTKEIGHRKEHGIFYTPEYITKYMVENTIEKWLNEKKKEIAFDEIKEIPSDFESLNNILILLKKYQLILKSISILDPSCGSGAFLTQAYNFLKKEWDIIFDIYQKIKKIISEKGYKNLTFEIIKDWKIGKFILKNNLFGVDLNMESVEISKLGLWLKTATQEDTLAILENNIKCGNSLIDDEKIAKEKAFNWNKEFPKIMKNGGFDIIVGNPPWGSKISKEEKQFLKNLFKISSKIDSSEYFIFKTSFLLKNDGFFTFIIPKSILFYNSWLNSRKLILSKKMLFVIDVGLAFENVNLESCILSYKNENFKGKNLVKIGFFEPKKIVYEKSFIELNPVSQEIMLKNNIIISTNISNEIYNILAKISLKNSYLKDFKREVFRGLYIPDCQKKDILDKGDFLFVNKVPDIEMYNIKKIRNLDLSKNYETYKNKIKKLSRKRIVFKVFRGKQLHSMIIEHNIITTEKLVNLIIHEPKINLFYALAVFNSKLISFYLQKAIFSDTTETARVMDDCFLSKIPLLNLQKKEQNYFANKVKEILELGKEQNKLQNKFINRINTNFKILKFGKKLKNFYLYNFVDFLIELEKVAYPIKKSSINNKKIKLTIRQQDEWEDYFLYYKDNLQKIVKDIESKKNNINNKIYKIYGLTKSEIELIEKF